MSAGGRLPLALAMRINDLCEQFEQRWREVQAGATPPRPEEFLEGLDGAARQELLEELLRIDTEYRRQTGEAFQIDEYSERFPGLLPERLASVARWQGVTLSLNPGRDPETLPTVAGYEILEVLGRGGMGVVYKAKQGKPSRLVALKMLAVNGPVSARTLARFCREAEAAAALKHPSIVSVHEVGEQNGRPYLTMEYVSGGSLDQRLASGPLPAHDSARLLVPIARAVHHAHQHGVIHRDLKPGNVLVDESGTPKIADFGLAKRLLAGEAELTHTTDMVGTPAYMAPEQAGASGVAVGPWTDIYGLGAILYECLTGKPPFGAPSVMELLLKIREQEPVPPRRLRAEVPRDLEVICLKCLTKDPRTRYASAAELADDVERFLCSKPVRARPPRAVDHLVKWSRRHPAVAVLLVALALTVIAGYATTMWQWNKANQGREVAEKATRERDATLDRIRIALAHREWLSGNVARVEEQLALCSDQQKDQWEWRYVQRLSKSHLLELIGHTATVRGVVYRPDGQQLASVGTDGTLRLWDLTVEPPSTVVRDANQQAAHCVAYRHDGEQLAVGHASGVVALWDVHGNRLGELPGRREVRSVAYLPDSRLTVGRLDGSVEVWDPRKQEAARLAWQAHRLQLNQIVASPDGRLLATASDDGTVRVWDAMTGALRHAPPPHALDATTLAFSPDGRSLASGGWDLKVRLYDLTTDQERFMLADHGAPIRSVSFSADGRRLASASSDGAMKVCDARTGRLLFALNGHTGEVAQIAFSPEGETLASCGEDRAVKIWDATGGQEAVVLPTWLSTLPLSFAFSPDGGHLAGGLHANRVGIWDLSTRAARYLPHVGQIHSVAYSTDGRELISVSQRGTVKRWDVATSKELPLPGLARGDVLAATYSSDGLVLVRRDGSLWRWFAEQESEVAGVTATAPSAVAFSGDRARLALVGGDRVTVLDIRSGGTIEVIAMSHATAVAMSRGGGMYAVGGSGGISLRRVGEPDEVICRGHAGAIHALAFSPDGRRLVSSSRDLTIRLWDTQTGDEVLTWRHGLHERSPVAFSEDGTLLAGVGSDVAPRVWSAAAPTSLPEDVKRKRALVWRDSETRESARTGHWEAALYNLDRILMGCDEGERQGFKVRRGRALAELGRLEEALAEFHDKSRPDDAALRRMRATVHLAQGRLDDYRRDCALLATLLGRSSSTDILYICVARPDSVNNPAVLVAAAERLEPTARLRLATLYRAGRHEEAARLLGTSSGDPSPRAWDLLFQAMVEYRLGRVEQAQENRKRAAIWIDMANRLARQGTPARGLSHCWVHWMERVEVSQLWTEAEALLAPRKN